MYYLCNFKLLANTEQKFRKEEFIILQQRVFWGALRPNEHLQTWLCSDAGKMDVFCSELSFQTKKRPYKRYHVELWSMVAEEAGLVEWGPWEGQSVEPPWQQRQATGASAGRWCSHWAMSGGSPAPRCQEIHGWGRGRDEGNPGWEQDGEASSTLLCGKEEIFVRNLFCKIHTNAGKEFQKRRFQRHQHRF